ncbi:hypothetical protein C1H76_6374 [Elsinoe australis]|uniref:Uncharacterized protein n=1 Tax=Elsinoe australis TaxID=40998 RepID=A0A4U7AXB6_9PEZI|nr:hypothetical protein C1H76_6374 [Elsinoe australis]
MIYINRNQKLDKHIAAQLTQTSSYDRGPLPFFKDEDNPTIYDDGRRVEYDEVAQTMDGDDSESSEVDDTTPELEHKDQDVKPKEAQVDQPALYETPYTISHYASSPALVATSNAFTISTSQETVTMLYAAPNITELKTDLCRQCKLPPQLPFLASQ